MKLENVRIENFRNIQLADIRFEQKTLIIGPNDIGKSNLIWAIRLLLDRNINDTSLELNEMDFYAGSTADSVVIQLKFVEVDMDCVLSKLREYVSATKELFIKYTGFKNADKDGNKFKIEIGSTESLLEEIQERYYRKVLNIKYMASSRDLYSYITKERKYLLDRSKSQRQPEVITADEALAKSIKAKLETVDSELTNLSYVKNATRDLNLELRKLASYSKDQSIRFESSSSDIDTFLGRLSISEIINGKSVAIGGDGRLNQIFLSLWAAKNDAETSSEREFSIICIEEPEAHLHPHQQKKIAEYLAETLNGQTIITTHSPSIAANYSPDSIIKLYRSEDGTKAASNGCSHIIEKSIIGLGHRMSIVPAESFFADFVLLVEGVSEAMFYRELANQLGYSLDKLNVSILSVEGVGFDVYVKILSALNISWAIRTDNDVFKLPKVENYRYAGIQRCMELLKYRIVEAVDFEELGKLSKILSNFKDADRENVKPSAAKAIAILGKYDLFLADMDLETDLANSKIKESLAAFYSQTELSAIVEAMKEAKGCNMFDFLRWPACDLKGLSSNNISLPITKCIKSISSKYE